MGRLQQNCVIVSASLHGLLAGALLFGSAFLSPSSKSLKPDDRGVLDFVPVKTIDDLFSGGGNPKAPEVQPLPKLQAQPQPQPQPPAPAPAPPPPKSEPEVKQAEPVAAKTPAPQKLDDEPDFTKPANGKRLPTVNKQLSVRKPSPRNTSSSPNPDSNPEADERAQARAAADARTRVRQAFNTALNGVGGVASSSTAVELKGPGGGGVPYANFLDAVKSLYARAWIVPDGVTDDSATAIASVTIARDGTVVSASITRPSGNALVDASVSAVLNRIRKAAPLPDDAKESQRSVNIKFNVRAARSLG